MYIYGIGSRFLELVARKTEINFRSRIVIEMSEQIADISQVLTSLSVAIAEAALLLQQQKEMQESHVSDLNQRVNRERLEKLGRETAKLRLSLKRSKEAERRRKELEKERNREK